MLLGRRQSMGRFIITFLDNGKTRSQYVMGYIAARQSVKVGIDPNGNYLVGL